MRFLVLFFIGSQALAYNPFEHMKKGSIDLFAKQNLEVFVYGLSATGLSLILLDSSVDQYFSNRNRLGGLENIGNQFLGTGIIGVGVGAAALLHAYLNDDDHSLQFGEAQLEALVANLGYTTVLKLAIPHERPDGGDHYSFPSGHTSTLMTTAAVIDQFYGFETAAPFYFLTALTAVSRMASGRHHLSDVIFGSTLGYLVGHSYSQHHMPDSNGKAFSILPQLDSNGMVGVTGTLLF